MFTLIDKKGNRLPGYSLFFNRIFTETILKEYNEKNLENPATLKEIENPIKATIRNFHYMSKQKRRGITSPLLLKSNTKIASGETDTVSFCIMTQGYVTIVYKDEPFMNREEFPEELVELIRKGEAEHHPDVTINENNWYELIIWDKDGNVLFSDDFRIDISCCSEEMMKELISDEIYNVLFD